ncbi:hypothetical protein V5P93_001818 [Actinokineospora auranticolor]|uniref:hypothetical protein n=1 Tax=Actinokineospora auranticolor TaxID=155976 RepID=UPI0011B0998B|nr:hypothetical protein [Actinokineospora auranticolor]
MTETTRPPKTTKPKPKSGTPEVRWMNRFCTMSKRMINVGDSVQAPTNTTNLTVFRRQFLDMTGRLVGLLDAVLGDLRELKDAPAPAVEPMIKELTKNVTEARDAVGQAKSRMESANPPTEEAYGAAVNRLSEGLPPLQHSVELVGAADLPDELVAAAPFAPTCVEIGATPTTTR